MSPRPGRIVFDERTPLRGDEPGTAPLRSDPAFVDFRERVAAVIDRGGSVEPPELVPTADPTD